MTSGGSQKLEGSTSCLENSMQSIRMQQKNNREIETDHESEDEAGESVLLNDWDEWLNTSDDDLSDLPSSSSDH